MIIVTGILSHNHEDTVAYGTIDNGKTISNNKRLTEKVLLYIVCLRSIQIFG